MKTRTRAVVIGGGIAGCSALYHLTREGWTDVVLLERDELTSGTTWHSAAQVTNFGASQVMVGLKSHSIKLYRELAADPDYPVGYHYGDGGIRLAGDERVMEGYRHFASVGRAMGVDFEVIDAAECARRHPLISTENLVGGLWDPHDGDIDAAQLCQALARRARAAGAEIYRHTAVTGLQQLRDDTWIVQTEAGDIACDVIVNAGGYRCNEIGAMMGVVHPVASMEHQYFVTDTIPEIAEADRRMPLLRCPISDYYCRQERDGLLVGFYEQDCKTWGLDGIDPAFTNALCPDDLDRVTDVLEGAFARMPALAEAGIKRIVNGPITYTIDGVPLVGPIPGKRNAFCITGLRAGLGEGGGHGWLLAQMIAQGGTEYDTWALDPRRFGDWATVALTAKKAVEDYQNEFRFHFPHEHRPAGRPVRVTPLTEVLAEDGAEFAVVDGWERVDMVPPEGFSEHHSFRFTEAFDVVAAEVAAVQSSVGLAEVGGFTRIEIGGADAGAFLDRMICTRLRHRPGGVSLGYLLDDHGCLLSEATLATLPDGRIWYGAAAAAARHDHDWLSAHIAADEEVTLTSLTESHTILVLAGPRARDLLSAVTSGDWRAASAPWLSVRDTEIGVTPVVVMAVSYSGELAFELHVPNYGLRQVYRTIRAAGDAYDLRLIGGRAIDSMRLEKGYLHWKAEIITEVDPFEAGLDRFVDLSKPFHGKSALERRVAEGPHRKLVTLTLEADHAPAHAGAAVLLGETVVGSVTSGDWGHRVGANIAMAYVAPEQAQSGTELAVEVLGNPVSARVADRCLYDPDTTLPRL